MAVFIFDPCTSLRTAMNSLQLVSFEDLQATFKRMRERERSKRWGKTFVLKCQKIEALASLTAEKKKMMETCYLRY